MTTTYPFTLIPRESLGSGYAEVKVIEQIGPDLFEVVLFKPGDSVGQNDTKTAAELGQLTGWWEDRDTCMARCIGQRVLDLRTAKGFSQQDLATIASISRPNVSRLEKGGHIPSVALLDRIADALETTIMNLVAPVDGLLRRDPKDFNVSVTYEDEEDEGDDEEEVFDLMYDDVMYDDDDDEEQATE